MAEVVRAVGEMEVAVAVDEKGVARCCKKKEEEVSSVVVRVVVRVDHADSSLDLDNLHFHIATPSST